MRRLMVAAVVLQAGMPLAINEVSAGLGEEVLQSCEAVLRSVKTIEPNRFWVPDEGIPCWHYLEAVFDMAGLVDKRQCTSVPCRNPLLGICSPPEVTLIQHIRIFVDGAKKYPQLLHLRASDLAVVALREAFPCQ
jgi:Rap1a immunity proteins